MNEIVQGSQTPRMVDLLEASITNLQIVHIYAAFSYNKISTPSLWSCGSSGSIVSDYGLDDRGSIPDRGRGFFF
jgi:hypothetical protein